MKFLLDVHSNNFARRLFLLEDVAMKAIFPPNSSPSDTERLEGARCPSAKALSPNNANLPAAESGPTRQVPRLGEGSVAFHRGITESQEQFSLKSACERLKKRTDQ